ncbi:hypothetical protein CR513_45177, partial [Mucuna pruriens]
IRYAYELLTNPLWKRDYDIFGIDEQLHIVESASKRYAGKHISELDFPLLQAPSGSIDHSSKVITASNFQYIFPDAKPWLIQLYSSGSERCAQFSKSWNKIASLLDVVANIGMVELGEKELAIYLTDKRSTGKPFFKNGIPSLVAIPAGCRATKCISRFDGELTVDKVTNWFATTVLALPQINYYSRELLENKVSFGSLSYLIKYLRSKKMLDEWRRNTLVIYKNKGYIQNMLTVNYKEIKLTSYSMKWKKVIEHKLREETRIAENQFGFMLERLYKMCDETATSMRTLGDDIVLISNQGKRLILNLSFGDRHWSQRVKVIFFSKSGERAAPFIRQVAKDYWAYASFAFILWREEESSYWWGAFGVESAPAIVFLKDPGVKPVVHHELPQLRSVTSMELGCDPHGYSRAGYDTVIWYCVIAVGRPSLELNKMRETMCRVQETLSKHSQEDASSENQSLAPAVDAFKRRRLTFAWLDGEKQK